MLVCASSFVIYRCVVQQSTSASELSAVRRSAPFMTVRCHSLPQSDDICLKARMCFEGMVVVRALQSRCWRCLLRTARRALPPSLWRPLLTRYSMVSSNRKLPTHCKISFHRGKPCASLHLEQLLRDAARWFRRSLSAGSMRSCSELNAELISCHQCKPNRQWWTRLSLVPRHAR